MSDEIEVSHYRIGDDPKDRWFEGDIFIDAEGREIKLARKDVGPHDPSLWSWEMFGSAIGLAWGEATRPLVRVHLVKYGHEVDFMAEQLRKNPTLAESDGGRQPFTGSHFAGSPEYYQAERLRKPPHRASCGIWISAPCNCDRFDLIQGRRA